MGKLTISLAMFNSYAKLLEGKYVLNMIIIISKKMYTIITVDIGKQHYIEENNEQMLVNIRHS